MGCTMGHFEKEFIKEIEYTSTEDLLEMLESGKTFYSLGEIELIKKELNNRNVDFSSVKISEDNFNEMDSFSFDEIEDDFDESDTLSNNESDDGFGKFYMPSTIKRYGQESNKLNVPSTTTNTNRYGQGYKELSVPSTVRKYGQENTITTENSLVSIINENETPKYNMNGLMGKVITIYKNKLVLKSDTSGDEKLIFFKDIMGIKYNPSDAYIQFETASMQMNNGISNRLNENTFAYDRGSVDQKQINEILRFIIERNQS